MTRAEVTKILREAGKEAEQQFQQSFGDLKGHLLETDPICLLSWLSFYGLTRFAYGDSEPDPEKRVWDHEVELIQAIALQNARDSYGEWNFRISGDVHDLAKLTQQSFDMRRLATQDPALSDQERAKLLAIGMMQSNTQIVRNWGHPDQIRRITTDLLRPLDHEIEQKWRVRTENLITMCFGIISAATERKRAYLERLGEVLRTDTITTLAQNYCRAFPDAQDSPDDLLQLFSKHQTSLDDAKAMIVHHSDLRLPGIFTFTLDDFVRAYPGDVNAENLQWVLKNWSLAFGDLKDSSAEHFFMNNPVWQSPLISLGNDTYFCPIIGMLQISLLELMEGIIESDVAIRKRYEKRRGDFLEDSVEQLFKEAFRTTEVFRGSLWNDPETGEQIENDLLVVIDSHLIIVEAKSGKVTEAAKRGAPERLKHTIKELQEKPSRQANRFARFLEETKGVHHFQTKRGVINNVDNRKVYQIVCLNCTLEDLGALSLPWSQLHDAGLIPGDLDLVPTISLADLEIVFHLLDSPLEKLHYLQRRADFEAHVSYLGDEMDLLTFYVETGFNIGTAEFEGGGLLLYGVDSALRPYFLSQMTGQEREKPKRQFTNWWKSLLSCIEARKQPGWTHSGVMLLNAAYEEQALFEKELQKRKRQLQRRKAREGNASFYLQIGPSQRKEAIIGLVCKRTPREQRKLLMENLCTRLYPFGRRNKEGRVS